MHKDVYLDNSIKESDYENQIRGEGLGYLWNEGQSLGYLVKFSFLS